MLSPDSPFRRLPVDLPRQQVLFIDALRLSAQMAAFSFENLEYLLKSLVNAEESKTLGEDVIKGFSASIMRSATPPASGQGTNSRTPDDSVILTLHPFFLKVL